MIDKKTYDIYFKADEDEHYYYDDTVTLSKEQLKELTNGIVEEFGGSVQVAEKVGEAE
jgi:hypothetical protein